MKFFDDMTRDEVCRAYADSKGEQYGFTEKDYEWADEHDYAQRMSDEDLLQWCSVEFGA
jgi:hypothetical protein